MIIKLTNKDDNFYQYMGKFFGSRLIQRETNDRIYDDSNKIWYIYVKEEMPLGFISIQKNTIKNLYATKPIYLTELFSEVQKDIHLAPSVVSNLYLAIYKECGFIINDTCYKNFVTIYPSDNKGVCQVS